MVPSNYISRRASREHHRGAMNTIHVFGMGFTQSLSNNSGQISLWLRCRQYSNLENMIMTPVSWSHSPKELAHFIALNSSPGTKIYGYFYSWGAGWLFRKTVARMKQLGLRFEEIVLCDPVYRSDFFPPWLPINPLSLTRIPRLVIPSNVGKVHWFYQKRDYPRGHKIVLEDHNNTQIVTKQELTVGHTDMEDAPEYHHTVLRILQESVK